MKIITAKLRSISPYSQSRKYDAPKTDGESFDDHYRRTWREHTHYNDAGQVFIPPMTIKTCLWEGAKFLSISVPGQGKSKYTKHFESGILVVKPLYLGIHKDDVNYEKLFLSGMGRKGHRSVDKYYPVFPKWEGDVEFVVIDEKVLHSLPADNKKTVFQHVLEHSGQLIGIGRFRPSKGGFYGRFEVVSVSL